MTFALRPMHNSPEVFRRRAHIFEARHQKGISGSLESNFLHSCRDTGPAQSAR
jgi:hypothetical protein